MSSKEIKFDCFCDDTSVQHANKLTYKQAFGMCMYCYDKIDAQECATQFFRNECKYNITTLCELEKQIQKLKEDIASLREHLKLYIGGVK